MITQRNRGGRDRRQVNLDLPKIVPNIEWQITAIDGPNVTIEWQNQQIAIIERGLLPLRNVSNNALPVSQTVVSNTGIELVYPVPNDPADFFDLPIYSLEIRSQFGGWMVPGRYGLGGGPPGPLPPFEWNVESVNLNEATMAVNDLAPPMYIRADPEQTVGYTITGDKTITGAIVQGDFVFLVLSGEVQPGDQIEIFESFNLLRDNNGARLETGVTQLLPP